MFRTRTINATSTSTAGSTTRSVTRRAAAPLAALAMAASGLAVSPAHAADPWIGLEAFAPEPMTVAAPVLAPAAGTLDSTTFATGLPQPSIAAFVIIGKVSDVKRQTATGPALAWKIGTGAGAKWVYNRAGTRLDKSPAQGNRVKVLANRLTTGGSRALIAERITRKSTTAADGAPDVEVAYLFTGAVSDPATSTWTVTEGTSSVQVDVSGTLTGEEVIDPELDGLAKGGRVTVEMVPAGTDLT